ncbi:MAG: PilN domain-containing protein [Pseudobdellovibrio sp.]
MIRINLLNSYKEMAKNAGGGSGGMSLMSDDEEKKKIYSDFAKRVVVLLIGPMGLYLYEGQIIPELQTQLNEANVKYGELKQFNDSKQGLAEEIKKYEITQARFTAQTDFINKIDRDKVNEYKLFEHLKNSTPENVWINKLELSGNSLTISAESDSSKEIEKFIQRLSNAEFIKNLIPTNQSNKKNFAETDATTTIMTLKAELNSEVSK